MSGAVISDIVAPRQWAPRGSVVSALTGLAQTGTPREGAALLLDIGTDDFLRYFDAEILGDLVTNGGATCRFFEGAYGSGKTHLLSLIQTRAVARGMCVVRTDLSQALSLEDWQGIVQHVLEKIECQIRGRRVTSLPRVLTALTAAGMTNVSRLKSTPLPHGGFHRAMSLVVSGEIDDADAQRELFAFLSGGSVSTARLKQVGVRGVRGALSKRNAEHVLRTVINGLRALGVPGTVLLFDEAERAFHVARSTPSVRVRAAANLMRRLVDACATGGVVGTAAIFAVLPRFVESCAMAYDALGQRLASTPDGNQWAWRWPVLPVEELSTTDGPDAFVEASIARFAELIGHCGGDGTAAQVELSTRGRAVLERNAGSGYRRELMKLLATVSLQYIK
jgi:hypothetical protein